MGVCLHFKKDLNCQNPRDEIILHRSLKILITEFPPLIIFIKFTHFTSVASSVNLNKINTFPTFKISKISQNSPKWDSKHQENPYKHCILPNSHQITLNSTYPIVENIHIFHFHYIKKIKAYSTLPSAKSSIKSRHFL